MEQLVLLVVAGITGLVCYSEAAKIEKRFRRGPWGVPAPGWAIVGFVAAGLVGTVLAAEVVVAALVGFVAYSEAAKFEKRGELPWGVPAIAWGVGCGSLSLIGALVESTFVVWLVVGFVGYQEAATYEKQYDKPLVRLSALVWGVAAFFFGLVGGLVAPVLVWTAVRAFSGLIGAYVLVLVERDALLVERNALLAERNTKQPPPAPPRAQPAPAPVVEAPVAEVPVAERWAAAMASVPSDPPPAAPRTAGASASGDFLPRKH